MPIGLLRFCVAGHNRKPECSNSEFVALYEEGGNGGHVSKSTISATDFNAIALGYGNGTLSHASSSLYPSYCPVSETEKRYLENVQRNPLSLDDFCATWKRRSKRNNLSYEFKVNKKINFTVCIWFCTIYFLCFVFIFDIEIILKQLEFSIKQC